MDGPDPARRAPGFRAVDRRAHRRGRLRATSRGSRLDRHSLVQLGQGVHQQRIRATMTSRTAAIGVDIASDKSLTNTPALVGGPAGAEVRGRALGGRRGRGGDTRSAFRSWSSRSTATTAAAWASTCAARTTCAAPSTSRCERDAQRRRGRRVVRDRQRLPRAGGRRQDGRGRAARPGERRRRRQAHRARAGRQGEHRPAARHRPRAGADPDPHRPTPPRSCSPSRACRSTPCPRKGARVLLAATGNMSTGGTSIDRTHEAHPDNVEIAETAAQVVGLDVAGIDFIVPDIDRAGARAGRRDRRGQRRAGLPDAHATRPRASRSTSPSRSSTCSSRRARTRASRSSA